MTPTIPFNLACCRGPHPLPGSTLPAGAQGPPGVEGPAPALAIGNVSSLAAGTQPSVQLRTNPSGGYFIDFGIPAGIAGGLTQAAADLRYALQTPANGAYRFVTNADGVFLELYNADTGQWHKFFVKGSAGQEMVAVGPAES